VDLSEFSNDVVCISEDVVCESAGFEVEGAEVCHAWEGEDAPDGCELRSIVVAVVDDFADASIGRDVDADQGSSVVPDPAGHDLVGAHVRHDMGHHHLVIVNVPPGGVAGKVGHEESVKGSSEDGHAPGELVAGRPISEHVGDAGLVGEHGLGVVSYELVALGGKHVDVPDVGDGRLQLRHFHEPTLLSSRSSTLLAAEEEA